MLTAKKANKKRNTLSFTLRAPPPFIKLEFTSTQLLPGTEFPKVQIPL